MKNFLGGAAGFILALSGGNATAEEVYLACQDLPGQWGALGVNTWVVDLELRTVQPVGGRVIINYNNVNVGKYEIKGISSSQSGSDWHWTLNRIDGKLKVMYVLNPSTTGSTYNTFEQTCEIMQKPRI